MSQSTSVTTQVNKLKVEDC